MNNYDKYAVLVKPWGVYVKGWDFFVMQGGLVDSWGNEWRPVFANSIEAARRKATK